MKSKLPILHLLWTACVILLACNAIAQNSLASQPPQSAQSGASQAHNLLLNVIQALENRLTISARVRHEVNMFGQKLVGSGIYLEERSGPCPLIRLELKTQLREKPSAFLQVCDGRYLWTYRNVSGKEGTLSRVDVAQVARALSGAEEEIEGGELGEWMGLGGLPRLMRALDANFKFETFEPAKLGQIQVRKLHGRWRQKKLAKILPKQKDADKETATFDISKLPRQLPDAVTLFVGKDDLFPYRIEYSRAEKDGSGGENESTQRPIVVMELFEVNLNVPIAQNRFIYNPGELTFSDQTASFLKKLGLKKKQ